MTSIDATGIRGRRPLALRDVTIDDSFWAPRREIVRVRTIPQQEHQLRTGGQFDALRLQWKRGEPEPHIFWESDVAKWIEAASYVLTKHPDPGLEASVDEAIDLLAGAQQPDGYLNVYYTVVHPGRRFTNLQDTHELYCAGHLIEAGVAHFLATGKRSLLDIAVRYADLIDREFGPGGAAEGGYDGHQEIELALVKLARVTGERRYLALSLRLIDNRGRRPFYFEEEVRRRGTPGYWGFILPESEDARVPFRAYNQSHAPVREQTEVVGHSVRAMYMYAAIADLAAEFDDAELRRVGERLWDDLTAHKLYLTGAMGPDRSIEGFGAAYELPNETAYGETCASIGLVMWSQRMANLTGEGQYLDVLERALYNGVLGGASADGTCYFYENPLATDGSVRRHEWFGVACCPPNFARLLSSLEHYVYSQGPREAVVNLHVAGGASFRFGDADVQLDVATDYPHKGRTTISVTAEHDVDIDLVVRIPGWARDAVVTVNGEPADIPPVEGFVRLNRTWRTGDEVRVDFALDVRRTWANAAVRADAGRIAFQRGPFVYCAEDLEGAPDVARVSVDRNAVARLEPVDGFDVTGIVVDGFVDTDGGDTLYADIPPVRAPVAVPLIPYFAWANRGPSTMAVWLRESVDDGREN